MPQEVASFRDIGEGFVIVKLDPVVGRVKRRRVRYP